MSICGQTAAACLPIQSGLSRSRRKRQLLADRAVRVASVVCNLIVHESLWLPLFLVHNVLQTGQPFFRFECLYADMEPFILVLCCCRVGSASKLVI